MASAHAPVPPLPPAHAEAPEPAADEIAPRGPSDAPPAADVPVTFRAVAKLNPDLDPFIFFGF